MRPLLIAYVIGVIIALAVMRDRWAVRVATALVWPLGPIAFVLVASIMVTAAAILWPIPVLGIAAILGTAAWFFL